MHTSKWNIVGRIWSASPICIMLLQTEFAPCPQFMQKNRKYSYNTFTHAHLPPFQFRFVHFKKILFHLSWMKQKLNTNILTSFCRTSYCNTFLKKCLMDSKWFYQNKYPNWFSIPICTKKNFSDCLVWKSSILILTFTQNHINSVWMMKYFIFYIKYHVYHWIN